MPNTRTLTPVMETFTARARTLGLSQADVARRMAVSPVAVNRWWNGGRMPDANNVDALMRALDMVLVGKENV